MKETTEQTSRQVPIRPASSLLAVRDGQDGLEVLVLKRATSLRFLPGFLSFPGGSIDAEDYAMVEHAVLGKPVACEQEDDLAYAVGALRECAEEAGVTFCITKAGGQARPLLLTEQEQNDLLIQKLNFDELLEAGGWKIAADAMRFVGRWITPPNMPARFDTRFFVTLASEGDLPIRINPSESSWGRWCRPQDLLEEIQAQSAKAAPPTVAMLRGLVPFDKAADCFERLYVPSPSPEDLLALAEKLQKS